MQIKKLKPGFRKLTPAKARLIAHLIGDGCVYQSKTNYNIKYEVKDVELLNQFQNDLIETYGLVPMKGFNPSGKTKTLIPFVLLRSKKAFTDLRSYCEYGSFVWSVPIQIMNSTKKIKREFLRSLFDDEGTVVNYGSKTIVRLYSVNERGLFSIQALLQDYRVSTKIVAGYGAKRNVYGLIVKDVMPFRKKIGFSLKRKMEKMEGRKENTLSSPSPSSRI